MYKTIPSNTISSVGKIYHLADIHIRNLKRHSEYITVFNRTAEYIKRTIQPNDIIYIAGDVVHAKTDMTPELVDMVSDFFTLFADIAPTFVITGNHDCNLNNKTRLDALSPIIKSLGHSNLHYLKNSGVYEFADVAFVVLSVFDNPSTYIKASEVQTDKKKIALYHGVVDNVYTDQGMCIRSSEVTLDTFSGYDLALFGDIHKPAQYIDPLRRFAYPGSLIQQNYGEALTHGILVWNLKNYSSQFIEIENDHILYTLDVDCGGFSDIPAKFADKQIGLRIRPNNTDAVDVLKILTLLKSKYNIVESSVTTQKKVRSEQSSTNTTTIDDVRDVNVQNELLRSYITKNYSVTEDFVEGVIAINTSINSQLVKNDIRKHIEWKPVRFEFSNMFSYGTDNVIDFTNMSGIYGLFAPNAHGKSSILDAITFCIFDKCSRTSKAINVLNNKSDSFYCKFVFTLDGNSYVIEKTGTRLKHGNVRVDIDFYAVDNGNKISMNGNERSQTNDVIRGILGTYEDFVLTALSVQGNNTGFIDMAQRERKDLLAQFLDISVFDLLYKVANTNMKELSAVLKEYQKVDYAAEIASSSKSVSELKHLLEEVELEETSLSNKIEVISNDVVELTSKITPLSNIDFDINQVLRKKDDAERLVVKIDSLLSNIDTQIEDAKTKVDVVADKLSTHNIKELDAKIKELDALKLKEQSAVKKLDKTQSALQHKIEKAEKLTSLEYDENCEYCMNNVFVKDAIDVKSTIQSDKESLGKIEAEVKNLKDSIDKLSHVVGDKKVYDALTLEHYQLSAAHASLVSEKNESLLKKNRCVALINELAAKISLYDSNKEIMAANAVIQSQIDDLRNQKKRLDDSLKNTSSKKTELVSKKSWFMSKLDTLKESLNKLKEVSQKYELYKVYVECLDRDGIPYSLISSTVPTIESNVNEILNQLVDFTIKLEMDGKNINCNIYYDDINTWPIELTSGMEKFISSMAIRTALVNISTLPKPNFLAIDEGLGTLDATLLNDFGVLLDYLNTQFEFILLISHIDSVRDMVNGVIDIHKTSEGSKIVYI